MIAAAPHTSNWDFWYARLALYVLGVPVKFTIKREWMRFPLSLILGPMGALGIDRRPKNAGSQRRSYVDVMTEIFEQRRHIAVLVTPEGTRSRQTQWKTGFYYVALQAGVPICLGYLDYANKIAGVGPVIHPSGDIAADMSQIMDFYRSIQGKHPQQFSTDERYDRNELTQKYH